ncbi:MAG: hypothetical protein J3K34DRAFT_261808 [Monoraphidium minutum]|nr:MAG: hypothetical protein J3K34DRAFT_261808 [Monoraphidium minutum]
MSRSRLTRRSGAAAIWMAPAPPWRRPASTAPAPTAAVAAEAAEAEAQVAAAAAARPPWAARRQGLELQRRWGALARPQPRPRAQQRPLLGRQRAIKTAYLRTSQTQRALGSLSPALDQCACGGGRACGGARPPPRVAAAGVWPPRRRRGNSVWQFCLAPKMLYFPDVLHKPPNPPYASKQKPNPSPCPLSPLSLLIHTPTLSIRSLTCATRALSA